MRKAAALAASGVLLCGAIDLRAQVNLGNVVCLGDSITEGKYGLQVPPGLPGGYRQYLQNDLSSFTVPYTYEFVGQEDNGVPFNTTGFSTGMADPNNEGYGSARIDQIINGIPSSMPLEGHTSPPIGTLLANDGTSANQPAGDTNPGLPNVVLLMIGTNDMLQGFDTNNAPTRLSQLVGDIVTDDPGVTLYVASILPDNQAIPNTSPLSQIQQYDAAIPGVVASYAAQGYKVRFVDEYSTVNPVTQTSDGIHPTYVGYSQVAQAWAQAIDENQRGLTTTVNTSTVTFNAQSAWTYGSIFVNGFNPDTNAGLESATAYFQTDSGSNFANLFVSAEGGTVYFESTQHLAALTIGTGAVVQATPTATGSHSVINVWQYLVDNGTLDLTNNALDVQSGNLASITSLIHQGYNNGTWTGTGITSSIAANDNSHLTALGVILNNVSGSALYGSTGPLGAFDGTSPASSDVLVKYTYYGDANLDGKVDGSDYSRIDAGYLSAGTLTGWYNGDFNYDGVIDGSDYTLIDNSFNQQGTRITAAVSTAQVSASPTGVPEPMGVASVVFCLGALGSRRRVRSGSPRMDV